MGNSTPAQVNAGPPGPPPLPLRLRNPHQERLDKSFASGLLSSDEMTLLDRAGARHEELVVRLRAGGMTESERAEVEKSLGHYENLIGRLEAGDELLATTDPAELKVLIDGDFRRTNLHLASLTRGVENGLVDAGEFQTLKTHALETERLRARAAEGGFSLEERRLIALRRADFEKLLKASENGSTAEGVEVSSENQALFELTRQTSSDNGMMGLAAAMARQIRGLESVDLGPEVANPELLRAANLAYGEAVAERPGNIHDSERLAVRVYEGQNLKTQGLPGNETGLPSVSESQAPSYTLNPELAQDELQRLDSNRDGRVSLAEANAGLREPGVTGERAALRAAFFAGFDKLNGEPGSDLLLADFEDLGPLSPKRGPLEAALREVSRPEVLESKGLYGDQGRPDPDSIHQGRRGSCWLLAALLGTPSERIEQIISERPGGGYEVRLAGGEPELIAPLTDAERLLYSTANGDWSAVLEKAVEQRLAREGATLDGGDPGVAMELILGTNARSIKTGGIHEDKETITDPEELARVLRESLAEGKTVTASNMGYDDQERLSGIRHVYNIAGYDPETQTLLVHNPWGRGDNADTDGVDDGVFEMSIREFLASVDELDISG